MSIETAIYNIVNPVLAALTPAIPFYWGVVPSDANEYVSLSQVTEGVDDSGYDIESDYRQFNIVMRDTVSGVGPMSRAAVVRELLKTNLSHRKGVFSGVKIQRINFVRSVELPNPETGEMIIASEYQFIYQGVF